MARKSHNFDLADPNFDPKRIFRKFWKYWKYLNIEQRHPSFMTADIHSWIIYELELPEPSSAATAVRLAICWYQCGFTTKFESSIKNDELFAQIWNTKVTFQNKKVKK